MKLDNHIYQLIKDYLDSEKAERLRIKKKLVLDTTEAEKEQIAFYCNRQILLTKAELMGLKFLINLPGLAMLFVTYNLLEKTNQLSIINEVIALLIYYLITILLDSQLSSKLKMKLDKEEQLEALLSILIINEDINKIPRACWNCSNYHGQYYGEELLICAVHPYGKEDCPDFDKV